MKATEFRVGNKVNTPDGVKEVFLITMQAGILGLVCAENSMSSVTNFYPLVDCYYLSFTEDWMLKNTEFELYETVTYQHVGTGTKTKCRKYAIPDPDAEFDNYEFSIMFVVDPDTDEFRNVQFHCYGHDISGGNIQQDSVHRLQNTYHTVTGEELTIKESATEP